MPSPSPEIIRLLSTFAVAFSVPTFAKVIILVCGAILAPGRRTVAASLRVMGLSDGGNFSKYHRVLSQAQWSPLLLSRLLLALIITSFLAPGQPLLLAIDDTLERRKGRKLKLKGWFRDPLSKTDSKVSAVRWVCLAVVVCVPWSRRHWVLPFMTVPAPSGKVCKKLGKRYKTPVALASVLIAQLRRWHPKREMVLLAQRLHPAELPIQRSSWYHKEEASFSDALAAVKIHLWTQAQRMPFGYQKYRNSTPDPHMQLIPQPIWNTLLRAVCYST